MQSINSEADSLVDTKELLKFIDTMDVRDASKVDESETQEESVHDVIRQDDIDPESESQFSSFMSLQDPNYAKSFFLNYAWVALYVSC